MKAVLQWIWTAGARRGKPGVLLFGEGLGGHREKPSRMWGLPAWAPWIPPHIFNGGYKLWLLPAFQGLLGQVLG